MEKRIRKYKAMGLPQREIDLRIAQSEKAKANNLSRSEYGDAKVKRALNKVSQRLGGDLKADNRLSMIRSVASKTDRLNPYLQSLLHPSKYMSHIPDICTFPRGVEQLRSVITASTYVSSGSEGKRDGISFKRTINGKDTEVTIGTSTSNRRLIKKAPTLKSGGGPGAVSVSDLSFVAFPYLNDSMEAYAGSFEMDGTSYTDEPWPVHGYTQWTGVLSGYRVVSMSLDATYIGPALSNSGQVTTACFPPWYWAGGTEPTTGPSFAEVSEYNFSYTGAAREGVYQLWTPAGMDDFRFRPVTSTIAGTSIDLLTSPFLVFAAKGLPLPEESVGVTTYLPVFRIEVVMNIETYSIAQLLTSTQKAGAPNLAKYNNALAVVAHAQHSGITNAKSGSADSIYQQIGSLAKDAAGFVWDNRATLIPMATSLVGSLI